MESTLQKRLAAALAAVLLLVAVAVAIAWRNAQQVAETSARVAHTREVIETVEHVLRLNVDAQTGLRGYLISAEQKYLEPYLVARDELPSSLLRLRELTADNPAQQSAAVALAELVAEHIQYRQRLVDVTREHGIEAARLAFTPAEGKHVVDNIRAAAARFRAEEQRLLTQREQDSRDADRRALWTLGLLAALIVATVLGAYWMLRRYLAARLHAERALRDSEQNLAVTLHSIGDAVMATDVAGRLTRLNPVAERLTGWNAAEAEGRPIGEVFRIVNEATREPAVIPVEQVLATGLVQGLANHTVLIARDGTEWPIADSAAPIRAADGSVVGVVLVFRDVTEQRDAEQASRRLNDELEQRVRERTAELEHAHQRLRLADFTVEHASAAIYWVKRDQSIVRVNRAACRMLDQNEQQLLSQSIADINPALAGERWEQFWRELGERREMAFEASHRRRDGALVAVEISVNRLEFEGAEYNVAFAHDITERKQAEQRLLQLTDELERRVADRTAELAAKNLQLGQANRLKSEFLANMSHELRTPLNAVIGFAEILGEGMTGELTAQQREFVRDIHTSGTHLLSLINDILDLSKVEAGSMQLELDAVQATPLIKSCLAVVRERALARRIDLRVDVGATLDVFEADSRKLKQIIFNLLSNAVKFTEEGGRVTLSANRVDRARIAAVGGAADRLFAPPAGTDEEFIELAVEDTGIGIAPADLARLFEPFVQVDASARRRHEGTGLGLALVHRLVELHGGALAVTSILGTGSRFTVWLPYRAATAPTVKPLAPPVARTTPLALVIEDDDAGARLLTRELEGQGLAVLRAATAEEGLVLARKHRPDLITLDIFLPHIDGWECLERLRADPRTAAIPVVIVSISSHLESGLSLGAVRVLQKPVSRADVLGVLKQLGLVAQTPATILVVDDDPAAVDIAAIHLQAAGMRVLRAAGGREAIALALAQRPQLIVLDIMMPEVSGFAVVAALQADSHGKEIPIVVVTAKQLSADERALLNGQVRQVVDKGQFRGDDFVAEVRRALSAASTVAGEPG